MVYTTNNQTDKMKYDCHGSKTPCTTSWTYDNWHCTGCMWKGFGVQDVKTGDDNLKHEYKELLLTVGVTGKCDSSLISVKD